MDVSQLYASYEHLLASTQLALAMLGMGALLTPPDFVRVKVPVFWANGPATLPAELVPR